MKYKNTVTGTIIDIPSVLNGRDWECISAPDAPTKEFENTSTKGEKAKPVKRKPSKRTVNK